MLNQAATIFLRDNTRGEIWESSQHCNLMSTLHKACCGFADAYRRSRYFRWIVGCNKEPLSRSLTSIGFSKAGSRGAATGGVSGGPCLGGRYPLISFLHSPPKGAYQKTY